MDHQASTSCLQEIKYSLYVGYKYLLVSALVVVCASFPVVVFADDPTPNPLFENITITATVLQNPGINPDTPPLSPSSGGGSPVNLADTIDVAIFRGLAYPGSMITLLKNGVTVAQIPVNADGTFDVRVRNLNSGTYSFGLRATDSEGLQSKLVLFTIYVSSSVATVVDGIFIPPTLTSDKIEVQKGNTIAFTGKSAPDTEIRLSFSSQTELLKRTRSDSTGAWFYELDSSLLDSGDYEAKARAVSPHNLSIYSDVVSFRVGDNDRLRSKTTLLSGFRKKCDLNNDNRVNLLDFSIMAYWYKRLGFPDKVDLNTDKQVNLTDLSILAFCWTG